MHFFLRVFAVVFGNFLALFELLNRFVSVAANIAHCNLSLFRLLADDLDKFLAAFLRRLRNLQADCRAVVIGRQAEVGFLNGAFNVLKRISIVRLNHNHARFRNCDVGNLIDGRRHAVIIDRNFIKQTGGGATCAECAIIFFQAVKGFVEPIFGGFDNFLCQGNCLLLINGGADIFANSDAINIFVVVNVEDDKRNMIIHAKASCGRVHDVQAKI